VDGKQVAALTAVSNTTRSPWLKGGRAQALI
jgi:hypothetical protein